MTAFVHLHRFDPRSGVLLACSAAWGACYATGFDLGVVVAAVANLVALISGDLLGAWRSHHPAVHGIGADDLRTLAVFGMIAAQALAIAVSWRVAAGVGLVLVLHLAHTLEPVRLARRGFAGPVALAMATVLLPAVTAYSAAGGQADPAVWLVFSGATALATGHALSWPAPHHGGHRTTAVRTRLAADAATQVTAGGLLMAGAGLWLRFGWPWAVAGVVACSAFQLAPRHRPDLSTLVLAAIPVLA